MPRAARICAPFDNDADSRSLTPHSNLGNVAELYDISCFASSPFLNDITNTTYAAWKLAPPSLTTQKVIQNAGFSLLPVLGQLYFIEPSPGAATIAKWDFTSSGATKGNPDAYTIDAADVIVLGNRPDIDIGNIQLHSIGGKLATLIYRLQMVGGRPPSSCSGSGSISVKFTGLYCKSTVPMVYTPSLNTCYKDFLGYHA
jgi:hypothetical protein